MTGQVVTRRPDGTGGRWLGELAPVAGLRYSFTLPGGPDQLSCVLQAGPRFRSEALDPGRQLQVYRGGICVWDGQLDEPEPGPDGWAVAAHGAGTFAAQFRATFSTWGTGTLDQAVNNPISRGLRWENPGIGNPAGTWLGQAPDSGSSDVADLLNTACSKGGLTWQVTAGPAGNVLSVFPLPSTVTRLLVATGPVARTIGGDINAICVHYQSSAEKPKHPAGYSYAWATDTGSITRHGRTEDYLDLSSAGVLSQADALAVANYVLSRYQRASFGGPFTVSPGEYLTAGGSPVDLGTEHAGEVVRLIVTDFGYGGEVKPGPVTFIAGGYEYDQDSGTAQVSAFQTIRHDFAGLLSSYADSWAARRNRR